MSGSLPPRQSSKRRKAGGGGRGAVKADAVVVVVIGGGIAGVSCAQDLARVGADAPELRVVLISESPILKQAESKLKVTEHLEELHVYERTSAAFALDNPRVEIIVSRVEHVNTVDRTISLMDGSSLVFDLCCICTGGRPRVVAHHPLVLGIRDLESVQELASRLRGARRIALIGNGGIALELAYTLRSCDIEWLVKDDYVGNTFFDASASKFVMDAIANRETEESCAATAMSEGDTPDVVGMRGAQGAVGKHASDSDHGSGDGGGRGWALGPDWVEKSKLKASIPTLDDTGAFRPASSITMHYKSDFVGIADVAPSPDGRGFPIAVQTTTGTDIECDFVVSATGVQVNVPFVGPEIRRSGRDNGLLVDISLQTSAPGVYAAGDCCSCEGIGQGKHWFQMRLWNQARNMGVAAAQSIWHDIHCAADESKDTPAAREVRRNYDIRKGNIFEIFTHITHFFGYKVVLIGRFNGQGLGEMVETLTKNMVVSAPVTEEEEGDVNREGGGSDLPKEEGEGEGDVERKKRKIVAVNEVGTATANQPLEIWTRMSPNVDYIKVTVYHGRVVGAMLVGDTDLEETFENLILNELDVSRFGIDLLDPNIDLEDYFD